MKRKMLVGVAAVALVAGSCGEGRLGVDEYYASAEDAAEAYDSTTDEAFDHYRETIAEALVEFQDRTADADTNTIIGETAVLLEVTVTEITRAFEQAEQALGEFVTTLSELRPPAEVQEAHDEAVATLQRSLDALPELIGSFVHVQSLDDISAAINGSAFGDVQPRVTAACRELQRLADESGVTADLHCGDPEQ